MILWRWRRSQQQRVTTSVEKAHTFGSHSPSRISWRRKKELCSTNLVVVAVGGGIRQRAIARRVRFYGAAAAAVERFSLLRPVLDSESAELGMQLLSSKFNWALFVFIFVPRWHFVLRALNSRAYPSVVHCRTGKVVGCRTSVLDVGALTSDRMLLSKLRMTCCCDARCSARELVGAQPPVQVLLCSMSTVINALAHRELPGWSCQ